MGMGYDKSKFVFSETFNNNSGKTSGSGFMGIILGLVGSACLIAAMVGWFLQIPDVIEIMGKIIIVLTLSAGLLGLRKFVGRKDGASIGENDADETHDDVEQKDCDKDSPQDTHIVDAVKPPTPKSSIIEKG